MIETEQMRKIVFWNTEHQPTDIGVLVAAEEAKMAAQNEAFLMTARHNAGQEATRSITRSMTAGNFKGSVKQVEGLDRNSTKELIASVHVQRQQARANMIANKMKLLADLVEPRNTTFYCEVVS
ncbi:MAG: hypothetical protein HYZ45_10465, partial [Burkholderiales bacterium]|nr:hypothetical protein [Burkholderiales bacterium]